MTKKDYIDSIKKCAISDKVVQQVAAVYTDNLPSEIKQMLSYDQNSIFFEDEYRTLSLSEVLEAEQDLHVNFVALRMIPLVDCGDNDFIIYDFETMMWAKFNIVDECRFKQRESLHEVLQ